MSLLIKGIVASVSIILILSISGCLNGINNELQGENNMPVKSIEEVLSGHTDELMSVPGVVGVAQGLLKGKPCITVFVIKKTPEIDKKIPKNLEGYPVTVVESGEIKAL